MVVANIDEQKVVTELQEIGQSVIDDGKLNEVVTQVDGDMSWGNEDIGNLFAMLKDYIRGEYRELPLATMLVSVGVVAYWVYPNDIIPDKLGVVGRIDDAVVANIALCAVHSDLNDYLAWKRKTASLDNALTILNEIK